MLSYQFGLNKEWRRENTWRNTAEKGTLFGNRDGQYSSSAGHD
jgi:hypothetical protein